MIARLLLLLIGGYRRWISPALPPRCRFAPTCSSYAGEAVRVHGAARGSWLTVLRLLRCQPFHPGGLDPVPPARPERSAPAVRSASVRTARGQVPRTPRSSRCRSGASPC